ncbi:MAG: dipicolinate synthase subunit B [Syntrophomonadaceae bacterium]|nr:dipicolinate synthase subunit B [Syntrophomonadaceae bacterium]MDD3888297.1 dipicolinate synthase subunit B [Syntrophomonadaceae bacterium]MDD4548804.1 dipicolinate synthase subunit B [Syntrophomonadaceae bacterium]
MQKSRLSGVKVGIVLTGSHCTIGEVIPQLKVLKEEGAELYPIFSYTVDEIDNRFYKVEDLKREIKDITDKPIINTIPGAEPIGPQKMLDVVAVVPATGNTIAKLANGIVDTPALMAVKAHLRNQRPVVIAVSTNDALSLNAQNIGLLINMKNIYFVPFRQDSPLVKANSLIADMIQTVDTIIYALQGKQIQPVLLGPA